MRKTPKEEPDDWCDGLTAPRNEPIQWDPKRGIDWQCPEFDCLRRVPQGERPASWLPEYSYPSDHCGGRVMDKWGYRWGQRMDELWLWAILPADVIAQDVSVEFHVTRMAIRYGDRVFHDGPLGCVNDTGGLNIDECGWVVIDVEQDEPVSESGEPSNMPARRDAVPSTGPALDTLGYVDHSPKLPPKKASNEVGSELAVNSGKMVKTTRKNVRVLHVEMAKKKNYWWRNVWEGHPTVQPHEVPFFKDVTFENDAP